ncbi:MAG: hypothetical protein F6J97_25045, partial [Leptolyngbya sp. SIO4C1]|nr:hypothetical protein [Leptolyngbya sp. SIO4C1]
AKSLSASDEEAKVLVRRYEGNPLALKIVATTICSVFDNSVSAFLKQGTTVFGDIRELLAEQFERLSELEKEIVYWLAVKCKPCSLKELQNQILLPAQKPSLLDRIDSLKRRSLIEVNSGCFSLQSVVTEYVKHQLVEHLCEEIVAKKFSLLQRYSLIEHRSEEQLRDCQTHHLLQPILQCLLIKFGSKDSIATYLTELLTDLSARPASERVTRNIKNLIRYLKDDTQRLL